MVTNFILSSHLWKFWEENKTPIKQATYSTLTTFDNFGLFRGCLVVNSKGFCFLFSNFCSCTEKLFCRCFQKAVWYSFHFCFWEIEKTEKKLFGTVFIFVFKKMKKKMKIIWYTFWKNENYLAAMVRLGGDWRRWPDFFFIFSNLSTFYTKNGQQFHISWCNFDFTWY